MSNTNQPASIWFAVDRNGDSFWYALKPRRSEVGAYWAFDGQGDAKKLVGMLWPGAIKAITGKTLTWADEPLEWKPGEDKVRKALEQLVHLHLCEQEGIASGQPTTQQWIEAINQASEALNQ